MNINIHNIINMTTSKTATEKIKDRVYYHKTLIFYDAVGCKVEINLFSSVKTNLTFKKGVL